MLGSPSVSRTLFDLTLIRSLRFARGALGACESKCGAAICLELGSDWTNSKLGVVRLAVQGLRTRYTARGVSSQWSEAPGWVADGLQTMDDLEHARRCVL